MSVLRNTQLAIAADLWEEDATHAHSQIKGDSLSAARRLSVYRNNFLASLTGAMAAVYPVIERLVGGRFFAMLADAYIREWPSRSGNLHEFGHALADFMTTYDAAAMLPYLADVARLEWAYHSVYHCAAPPPCDLQRVRRDIIKEGATLHLNRGSACRLVRSDFPIFRIWQVNQENFASDATVNLDIGSESVLVIRPQSEVELWLVPDAEAAFLGVLIDGGSLSDAVAAGLQEGIEFDLSTALRRYLSSGALTQATAHQTAR